MFSKIMFKGYAYCTDCDKKLEALILYLPGQKPQKWVVQ